MAPANSSADEVAGRRQRPDRGSLPPIAAGPEEVHRRKKTHRRKTNAVRNVQPGSREGEGAATIEELHDDVSSRGASDEDTIRVTPRYNKRSQRSEHRTSQHGDDGGTGESTPRRKTKRKKQTSTGTSSAHPFAPEQFHGTATAAWTALHEEDIVGNATSQADCLTSPLSRSMQKRDHHHFFEHRPKQPHKHEQEQDTDRDDESASDDGGINSRTPKRPNRTGYGVLHAGGFKRATRVQDFSVETAEDSGVPEVQLYGVPYIRALLDLRFANLTSLAPSILFGFVLCFQLMISSMHDTANGSDTIVAGCTGHILILSGLLFALTVLTLLCVVESAVESDFDKGTRPWLILSSLCIVISFGMSLHMQKFEIEIHRFGHNNSLFFCNGAFFCSSTTLSQTWVDKTENWYTLTIVRTVLVSFAWFTHYMSGCF
eukprot:m.115897 g.115897  ORF g.115897 m.115897 type:complete len:430 (+) comp17157_c0_seq1:336-1625(+)